MSSHKSAPVRRSTVNSKYEDRQNCPLAEMIRYEYPGFAFDFTVDGFYAKRNNMYFVLNDRAKLREFGDDDGRKSPLNKWGRFFSLRQKVA